jgi:hypothetical protein
MIQFKQSSDTSINIIGESRTQQQAKVRPWNRQETAGISGMTEAA